MPWSLIFVQCYIVFDFDKLKITFDYGLTDGFIICVIITITML